MTQTNLGLEFDALGIATALKRFRLHVPVNQRSYKWKAEHVQALFEDLLAATRRQKYFLGTIVLTKDDDGNLEVADGQQRLATASVLIAAIRDYLYTVDATATQAADKFTSDYLLEYDVFHADSTPKLRLNSEDNEYFLRAILSKPGSADRIGESASPRWRSNERLKDAADMAAEFVQRLVAGRSQKDGVTVLYEFVEFLEKRVSVILITADGTTDAFKMFETLNDRGLKVSQTDILKNFLLDEAGEDRLKEAHARWMSLEARIEAHNAELLLDYLRHYWIANNGPTRAADLAESVKKQVQGPRASVETVFALDDYATSYIALLQALDHPALAPFGDEARTEIHTVASLLKIEQIRPLLLAVVRKFDVEEARRAFPKFVCWSVRFLIAGGGGGGVLDRHYGEAAHEVTAGKITRTKQLSERMEAFIPSDTKFREAFARASVSVNRLARYYLRSLENERQGRRPAHAVEFEAPQTRFGLEHVMPENAAKAWGVEQEIVNAYCYRLGNLCMMGAKTNVELADGSFQEKLPEYRKSPFLLTQDVATYLVWGELQIDERQRAMAELAPKVWPL